MAYKSFSTGLANHLLKDLSLKEIFAAGILEVYSGAPPASADAAVTGTLLARITLASGAFVAGTSTNGLNFDNPVADTRVISKAAAETWSGVGIADGVAGWARLKGNAVDAGGVSTALPRIDVDIANSGATWLMVQTTIVTGAPLLVAAFTITVRTT